MLIDVEPNRAPSTHVVLGMSEEAVDVGVELVGPVNRAAGDAERDGLGLPE